MPFSRASCGVAKVTGWPLSRISPPVGWNTPDIALISVVLPAPLSPASATTSPGRTAMEKSLSARTAPKCLERLRTSSRGVVWLLLFILTGSTEPALRLVDKDGNDDDDADGDELPERLDIDEDQPVLDDRDHQRTGDRAENGAGAAEQAGAADDHGRDTVEQQRLAG